MYNYVQVTHSDVTSFRFQVSSYFSHTHTYNLSLVIHKVSFAFNKSTLHVVDSWNVLPNSIVLSWWFYTAVFISYLPNWLNVVRYPCTSSFNSSHLKPETAIKDKVTTELTAAQCALLSLEFHYCRTSKVKNKWSTVFL